ncbi:MAG: glycosyltransferase family 4 protein [Fibromonadaceae bacterium]|jgi:hypothetical protein|nr:glycosyltransferase family 4 protein [Fibromonadaceae bacterium]
MKIKTFIITTKKISAISGHGGSQCANRNFLAFCNYFNASNITIFNLYECYTKSKILKRINFLFFRWFGLDKNNERVILNKIADADLVFIEDSRYGRISKIIKQKYPLKKIIVFFHNSEYEYIKQEHSHNLIRQHIVKKNEEWACKYSDKIVVLNKRDKSVIQKLYGRVADAVIPISFSNKQIEFNKNEISYPPTALFLGSNFFANIHGIKWFIEKVLPFVKIKLKIVGKNMDKANLPKNDKLEIIGYIESLDDCMQNADFIVLPIFKGSGMKVKTCEALMHGKNIIGTQEAFQGYDVDFEKVGACCETAEEFIKAINEFPSRFNRKYNEYSRSKFLEKYSNDVTFRQFAKMFEELE